MPKAALAFKNPGLKPGARRTLIERLFRSASHGFQPLVLAMVLLAMGGSLIAQEDDFDFGEGEKKEEKADQGAGIPLRGKVRAEAAKQVGDDGHRFNLLGPALNLILDYNSPVGKFYGEGTGRANFSYRIEDDPEKVREEYEIELVGRELYWEKAWGNLTVSVGNRITVFSKADVLPVTDLITPADQTNSYFAKPEESRLGQNVIRADLYTEKLEFNLMAIPYPMHDRFTDGDHPYSISPGSELENKTNEREPEAAARINYLFSQKGSVALIGGYFHNRLPVLETEIDLAAGTSTLNKTYPYYYMGGASFDYALDPFLIKFEGAYKFRQGLQQMGSFTTLAANRAPANSSLCPPVTSTPLATDCFVSSSTTIADGHRRTDVAAAMIGFDYSTNDYGTFILEGSVQSPIEKHSSLQQNRDQYFVALGWSKDFFRDTLTVSNYVFFLEQIENVLYRFSIGYDVTDNFTAETQYTGIFIEDNRQEYQSIKDFDRVDVNLIYNFDLAKN